MTGETVDLLSTSFEYLPSTHCVAVLEIKQQRRRQEMGRHWKVAYLMEQTPSPSLCQWKGGKKCLAQRPTFSADFQRFELRENVARCHSGSVLESRITKPLFFAVERKTSPACCDWSNSSIKSRTLVSIRISTAEIRERKQKQKQTLDKNSGDEGQSVANFSSRYQNLNSKYSS